MNFIMKIVINKFLKVEVVRDLINDKFFPWLKAKAESTDPEYDDKLVELAEEIWMKIGDGIILQGIEALKKNLD